MSDFSTNTDHFGSREPSEVNGEGRSELTPGHDTRVPVATPVGIPIVIPGRSTVLPQLYQVENHPLRKPGAGRTFVYLQDTDEEGLRKSFQAGADFVIPVAKREDVTRKSGSLELLEGDAVFARDMWGSGNANDNVIQAWVVGRNGLSQNVQDRVENVRNIAHGDDDFCGPDRAKKDDGEYVGGIAFERNDRAIGVGKTRCYTVGTSYQAARVLSAPAKGGKWSGEWDDDLLKRKEFVSTMTACATEAMQHAPDKVIENLKSNAEMCNLPRVGCADNYYYQSVQYNVAHAERFHSGATLTKDMGSFGRKHQDLRDGPPAYSAGTSHSKLPEGYDNGCFFLCELGVHVYLTNMQVLHFSGLKTHGGSVPTAPEGVLDIAKWAYRFFVICYPPGAYTNGTGRLALAALPNHDPFIMGPEMTNLMSDRRDQRAYCTQATFAEDGAVIMEPVPHFNFFVRALYQEVQYFLQQLPLEYDARIDIEHFLSAFSMILGDKRLAPEPWPLGPGHHSSVSPSADEVIGEPTRNPMREEAIIKWVKYYNETIATMPHARLSNKFLPEVLLERGKPSDGGRPLRACQTKRKQPASQDENKPKRSRKKAQTELLLNNETTAFNRMKHTESYLEFIKPFNQVFASDGDDIMELSESNIDEGIAIGGATDNKTPLLLPEANDYLESEDEIEAEDDEELHIILPSLHPLSRPNKPAFPDCITLDNIYLFLRGTHDAVQLIEQTEGATFAETTLDNLYTTIRHTPLSGEAAACVGQMWQALQTFESLEQLSFLDLHIQHRRIMVTNYSQWLWLEVALVNECRIAISFDSQSIRTDWIFRLVQKICSAIVARTPSVVFRSKDFIPQLSVTSPYHYYTNDRTRLTANNGELDILIIRTFKAIMKCWLGYPLDIVSEMRFYFLAYILRCFPPATLLLDEVWDAYHHLHSMVFGKRIRAFLTPETFSDVFTRMQSHALASADSKEAQLVTLIGGLFEQFSRLPIEPVTLSPSVVLPSPASERHHSASPTPNAIIPTPLTISASSPKEHSSATFIAYLRELMPLTDPNYTGPMTTLMKNVMKDPDGLLPWRLKAPSLNAAFAEGGPFSKGIIDTPIGLWNGLILRGITFGCDVVKEGPSLYKSLDEWDSIVVTSESKGSQFICKPSIYGNAIYNRHKGIGRSPQMASIYWNASKSHAAKWASMGQGEFKSFDTAVKFFKKFDLIGALIAVLMAGDYACAGKFDMPNAHIMGGYIKSISAGALGCMKLMGTVVGKGNKESCQSAFVELYEELDVTLTDEEKKTMEFSTVMQEHAMCKYYKAVTHELF